MNPETWAVVSISVVIVPSVAWLVRAVLKLQIELAQMQTRESERDKNCERHQKWNGELQKALTRMDKNITRLCQQAGLREEAE